MSEIKNIEAIEIDTNNRPGFGTDKSKIENRIKNYKKQ